MFRLNRCIILRFTLNRSTKCISSSVYLEPKYTIHRFSPDRFTTSVDLLKSPTGGDSDQLFSLSTTSVLHETDGAIEKEYDGDFDIDDDEEEEEFHGYDGYDEDNDDDLNAEDVDSEEEDDEIDSSDLHMKIEEFIDKVYKKWKEETVGERLLCIAATEFN
ncbi:hypothetical protein Q3G72_027455 [Acer saccharum]|nr:hypothetical protein Q3G72_027455 [Acer saccharum]